MPGAFPLRLSLATTSPAPRSNPDQPIIALSPAAARSLGLKQGQAVQVTSAYGRVSARLHLQASLAPDQAVWSLSLSNASSLMKLLSPLMNESGGLLREDHLIAVVPHPTG
jgi:anaerobic selenocysteine-containing dehydrogenase